MKKREVVSEWRYDYKADKWKKDFEIVTTAEDSCLGERIKEWLLVILIAILICSCVMYANGYEITFDNGFHIEEVR